MIEIYCAGFNLIQNHFDWKGALSNFCSFADRVTICINKSNDNTLDQVQRWGFSVWPDRLNIVTSEFDYLDYAFDGKIKNAALQATKKDGLILLDLDERIPIRHRSLWDQLFGALYTSRYEAFLIPSVNLCGSVRTYKDIGYKFYLHKKGLKRGIVNYAKLPNGKIDISKSDTTEPIHDDGSLVLSYPLSDNIDNLRGDDFPFVFHLWAVNYEQRLLQNEFWAPVWQNRAGKEVDNILNKLEDLKKIPIQEHNLKLWNE